MNFASGRIHKLRSNAQKRGLPCPVGAEESDEFAWLNFE
jgi:hypothetical protein